MYFVFPLCIFRPTFRHSSAFAFPNISLGFTILGTAVLGFTIEVVTFHLCRWGILGVFLLLVFTCLGHECQAFLSPYNGMLVCADNALV